jgi:SARP family transcriptional regulator, regulator of embCAB operon
VLADIRVGRRDAEIVDTGTGFVIVDLRSAMGIRVNGVRIKSSAPLTDGSLIRIGGHEFTFEI